MTLPEKELWRIEVFRGRLKTSLAARFWLRFHVSAMLLCAALVAWLADVALLRAGLHWMHLRFPLAIAAGYGAFLAAVRAWLAYSGIGQWLNRKRAAELVGGEVPSPPPPRERDVGMPSFDFPFAGEPEGCFIAIALLVVVLAVGGYVWWLADALFADIVLELLLASGLLPGVGRLQRSGWMASAWSNTWVTLALLVVAGFLVGLFARNVAPQAATLGELWSAMHPARGPAR